MWRAPTEHRWMDPGLSAGGTDPCALTRKLHVHRKLRGARRGTSILAPPCARPRKRESATTASNLDTLLDRGFRSKGAHAVEFSKTVAPLGRGFLPLGRPGCSRPLVGRTNKYSAQSDHRG